MDIQVGTRIGHIVVVDILEKDKNYKQIYLCQCDCGTTKKMKRGTLLRKLDRVLSCGCQRAISRKRHGHKVGGKPSATYSTWESLKKRCKDKDDKNYGGRGIKYCEEWEQFENFLKDVGEKPQGFELDRIDNDGDYEPNNVRWISHKENCSNRSDSIIVTIDDKSMCVASWCKKLGVNKDMVYQRIRRGWDAKKAIQTKSIYKRKTS